MMSINTLLMYFVRRRCVQYFILKVRLENFFFPYFTEIEYHVTDSLCYRQPFFTRLQNLKISRIILDGT